MLTNELKMKVIYTGYVIEMYLPLLQSSLSKKQIRTIVERCWSYTKGHKIAVYKSIDNSIHFDVFTYQNELVESCTIS